MSFTPGAGPTLLGMGQPEQSIMSETKRLLFDKSMPLGDRSKFSRNNSPGTYVDFQAVDPQVRIGRGHRNVITVQWDDSLRSRCIAFVAHSSARLAADKRKRRTNIDEQLNQNAPFLQYNLGARREFLGFFLTYLGTVLDGIVADRLETDGKSPFWEGERSAWRMAEVPAASGCRLGSASTVHVETVSSGKSLYVVLEFLQLNTAERSNINNRQASWTKEQLDLHCMSQVLSDHPSSQLSQPIAEEGENTDTAPEETDLSDEPRWRI